MRKDLVTAALAVLVFTALTGIAYPLVVTGIGRLAFPGEADGSQITRGGRVVGSELLAQPFVIDTGRTDADGNPITRPDRRYFQPRPSQTGYDPAATAFSNRGPNQKEARAFYRAQLEAYTRREGVAAAQVPVDAVTTSGSGVDPHISQAIPRIQARRVARVRRLPLVRVLALVDRHTDGRFLGVFGEPGVNVTQLNFALDGSR